jgi:hypothetical protein
MASAQSHVDPALTDPHVFFFEDFESGGLGKWDNRFGECDHSGIHVIDDPACVFAGRYALEYRREPGKGLGPSMPVWFMPGHDTVYARWYCHFAPDYDQGELMHLNRLIGGPPDDYEVIRGRAGTRPTGTDFFTTGIEPCPLRVKGRGLGPLVFYTYHPDMPTSPTGFHHGQIFGTDPPLWIERGRWYCMEMMVQCNTPGEHDGEQAAWVDGEQVLHITGLRWRDTEELKIHCFRLHLYIGDSPGVNRVWFDNVALSTGYTGPVRA